jgi:5-methylcytosine-specific restriction protein B
MLPDPTVLEGVDIKTQGVVIDLSHLLRTINARIEALYDRDHTVGHAYFMKLKEISDAGSRFTELKATFKNRIIPLLQEYFFEDWQKIRLVLGDNQKRPEDQFIQALSDVKVEHLFGTSDELDDSMIKPRFSIQETALDRPSAYVGIYKA